MCRSPLMAYRVSETSMHSSIPRTAPMRGVAPSCDALGEVAAGRVRAQPSRGRTHLVVESEFPAGRKARPRNARLVRTWVPKAKRDRFLADAVTVRTLLLRPLVDAKEPSSVESAGRRRSSSFMQAEVSGTLRLLASGRRQTGHRVALSSPLHLQELSCLNGTLCVARIRLAERVSTSTVDRSSSLPSGNRACGCGALARCFRLCAGLGAGGRTGPSRRKS